MKLYRVVEVTGGHNSGDREMVEIDDNICLVAYASEHGIDPTSTYKCAEWVIEE